VHPCDLPINYHPPLAVSFYFDVCKRHENEGKCLEALTINVVVDKTSLREWILLTTLHTRSLINKPGLSYVLVYLLGNYDPSH
jgi:hypothetical protein